MLQLPARKNFITLLMLMLAALSVWLFQDQPKKGRSVTPLNQNAPDSFMENFTSQTMDAQGRPQYQLSAARMTHFADDGRSELVRPHFTAYRSDGQRWTVESESGVALDDARQILLNGEVTIERFMGAAVPANLQIHTRDVRVRTKDDYAETDKPTTIVQGESTLSALGMQVYFRRGQLHLLSQVRGRYEP